MTVIGVIRRIRSIGPLGRWFWCAIVAGGLAGAQPAGAGETITAEGRVTQRFEIYNPHSLEQLQEIKRLGFTQVILDWPTLHADATGLGLDVVLAHWWTVATEPQEMDRAVEFVHGVDPQRLVGFSIMDEPERNSPETTFAFYRGLYQDLRKYFDRKLPSVKLEISHWGPLASWTDEQYASFVPLYQAADRMRLMPYPDLYEGPLSEVYLQMARSRQIMQLAERDLPLVVILQAWVLPENPKLPTIDELRVMAYLAMLGGAETVSFFTYDPQLWERTDPGFTQRFAELMRELTAFKQQYGGTRVESQLSPAGVLTATLSPTDSPSVQIVINTNRERVDELDALAVVVPEATTAAGQSLVSCTPPDGPNCCPSRARRSGRHILRPFRHPGAVCGRLLAR